MNKLRRIILRVHNKNVSNFSAGIRYQLRLICQGDASVITFFETWMLGFNNSMIITDSSANQLLFFLKDWRRLWNSTDLMKD